jgi:hypothetical protein
MTAPLFIMTKGAFLMKRLISLVLCAMLLSLSTAAWASLDGFLGNLNIQAQADLPGFKAKVSAQFGVPLPRVEAVFTQVSVPADVFMTFQLGEMAHKQPETVLKTYKVSKSKGWGAIAKELGIKPGSADFHALKRGDLSFTGQPVGSANDPGPAPGKSKGKGKGHNK